MGSAAGLTPRDCPGRGQNCYYKDWARAGFPFLSISHKLRLNEKEKVMSTIVLAILLLIRILVPLILLIALGEWVRRREASYWTRS